MFLNLNQMSFKDISYLEMPFSLAELNHLCNFHRGHHEEQSLILFLIWTRCRLKNFLSIALVASQFGREEPFVHFC